MIKVLRCVITSVLILTHKKLFVLILWFKWGCLHICTHDRCVSANWPTATTPSAFFCFSPVIPFKKHLPLTFSPLAILEMLDFRNSISCWDSVQEHLCCIWIRRPPFLLGDTADSVREQQGWGPVGLWAPDRRAPAGQPSTYRGVWQESLQSTREAQLRVELVKVVIGLISKFVFMKSVKCLMDMKAVWLNTPADTEVIQATVDDGVSNHNYLCTTSV